MNTLVETGKVLGGGTVELHTVEGFFLCKGFSGWHRDFF